MATLFEECVDALKDNVTILSEEETKKLCDLLEQKFPILISGHIDWSKYDKKVQVESIDELASRLKNFKNEIYIFWDDAGSLALKTSLEDALSVIDDVTAVGFYTWLFSPDDGYVIEFGFSDATIGFF